MLLVALMRFEAFLCEVEGAKQIGLCKFSELFNEVRFLLLTCSVVLMYLYVAISSGLGE